VPLVHGKNPEDVIMQAANDKPSVANLRQAAANGHGQCELGAVFEQFRANRSPASKEE